MHDFNVNDGIIESMNSDLKENYGITVNQVLDYLKMNQVEFKEYGSLEFECDSCGSDWYYGHTIVLFYEREYGFSVDFETIVQSVDEDVEILSLVVDILLCENCGKWYVFSKKGNEI